MADDVAGIFAKMRERAHKAVRAGVEEIGGQVEDELASRLNVAYPPASVPGESPHRRTGKLRAGVTHDTVDDDNGITTQIRVTRAGTPDVPDYLESGTSRMAARPFVQPVKDDWEKKLLSRAETEIRSKNQ